METAKFLDNSPRMLSSLGYAFGVSGQRDKARKIIDELRVLSKRRYVSSFAVAIVHAGLGEENEALALLERAYNERSDTIVILKMRIKGSNEFSTSPAVNGWETKYNQFFSPIHGAFDRGFSHLSPTFTGLKIGFDHQFPTVNGWANGKKK